eukprot:1829451-Alexandrium_andersonii.AAC.1
MEHPLDLAAILVPGGAVAIPDRDPRRVDVTGVRPERVHDLARPVEPTGSTTNATGSRVTK